MLRCELISVELAKEAALLYWRIFILSGPTLWVMAFHINLMAQGKLPSQFINSY
ncbi:UNVERIFIED_CONTAM: hypothetical protein FKN15_077846 [Acipenser sinensis]